MVIHVTPQPLFRILLTRHIITLTNLVCRIGLIRINTTHAPNFMTNNYQINFNSSQSQCGFTSPESNFQPTCSPYLPCPQFSQYSFPGFASYTSFLNQPIEEKSELEKSLEVMHEAKQKFQASPIPQYFQDSYSVPPVQNRKPSILEMSMCESE